MSDGHSTRNGRTSKVSGGDGIDLAECEGGFCEETGELDMPAKMSSISRRTSNGTGLRGFLLLTIRGPYI